MGRELKTRLDACKSTYNNDKNAILQDTKIFSKLPINSKKCAALLTRILSLLNCGHESLTESESTEIFFGVTRLFESDDERLRRLIYLLIKSLPVNETEIFIVTSSLTKDINSPNHVYRANAIRAICSIMKTTISAQIERYLKSSLVDGETYVSSSTLLCCIGMFSKLSDILRRWVGEITTCLSNSNQMVKFHATILLFLLRANDKQSIRKLISTLDRNSGNNVQCFIIRFLCLNNTVMETECINILNSSLKGTSDVVKLEAVKSIISLLITHVRSKNSLETFPYDLKTSIEVLKHFLSSGEQVYIFSAMRQFSILAQILPSAINSMNKQVESLISHNSRGVSSLALLTLLQTGSADTIENLLAQASSLSGEFKLDVSRAIKRLCITHPDKYKPVLKFFANNFREESSFVSKNEMAEATMFIVSEIPQAQEIGINNLCEFIEDCEYATLNAKILKFLGNNIPKTKNPEEYVRYIYNRLLLENPLVRNSSIDALDNIAKLVPRLKRPISKMLFSCLGDNDYNYELNEYGNLVFNVLNSSLDSVSEDDSELFQLYSGINENVSLINICKDLQDYIEKGHEIDITIDINDEKSCNTVRTTSISKCDEGLVKMASLDIFVDVSTTESQFPNEVIEKIQGAQDLVSTLKLHLTEEEEDYNVNLELYVSKAFIVAEFNIENTLNDQTLENISISFNHSTCVNFNNWNIVYNSTIDCLNPNEKKQSHLVLSSSSGTITSDDLEKLLLGVVKVNLIFSVKCGQESFDENYNMNNLNLGVAAYMGPWIIEGDEFNKTWDSLQESEDVGTFNLQFKSIDDACNKVTKFLGMNNCMDSAAKSPGNTKLRSLNLAGKLLGEYQVLAKATIAQANPNSGCALKLQLRTEHRNITKLVFSQLE